MGGAVRGHTWQVRALLLIWVALFALTVGRGPAAAAGAAAQGRQAGRLAAMAVEQRFRRLDDPERLERLTRIGRRIETAAGVKPGTFTFRILEIPEFNALSLPGNIIYVMQGLVDTVGSEDELAAVVAHEMAHSLLGHTRQLLEEPRTRRVALVVEKRLPDGSIVRQRVAAGDADMRAKELDADRASVPLVKKAGYRPEAALAMLEHLERLQGARSLSAAGEKRPAMSTHPTLSERIRQMRQWVNEATGAVASLTHSPIALYPPIPSKSTVER